MSKPFSEFGKDMGRLSSHLEQAANKLVVDAAAKAGGNIADRNPIDTGLSSGNWEGTIGQPAREEQQRFFPTASKAAMSFLRAQKKKTGQSVFVSNPVPYVRDLNLYATSPQAPVPMWVERQAERGIKQVLENAKVIGRF
jgi:hypothetical protein